jgi:hypothetical protein
LLPFPAISNSKTGAARKQATSGFQHPRRSLLSVITPATIYLKVAIPAKAGIQKYTGCRIKSGMTFYMFSRRSNKDAAPLTFVSQRLRT